MPENPKARKIEEMEAFLCEVYGPIVAEHMLALALKEVRSLVLDSGDPEVAEAFDLLARAHRIICEYREMKAMKALEK